MAICHLIEQRRSLAALVKAVVVPHAGSEVSRRVPGPVYSEESAPPPSWLIDDYVRLVGGDVSSYRGRVPHHLFPQWAFPTLAAALQGSGHALVKVVNAGCDMTMQGDIDRERPIQIKSQLVSMEDKGRRTLLRTRVATGNPDQPEALVAHVATLVPRAGSGGAQTRPKTVPTVPYGATEVASFRLSRCSARRFADLTGDYNPIHWLPAYARLMGFRGTILHGFGSLAWSFEGLVRGRLSGRVDRIRHFEARFTRPLVLPATVGLFLGPDHHIALGTTAGAAAYLEGSYRE